VSGVSFGSLIVLSFSTADAVSMATLSASGP